MTNHNYIMVVLFLLILSPLFAGNTNHAAPAAPAVQNFISDKPVAIEIFSSIADSETRPLIAMSRDDIVYPGNISGTVTSDLGGTLSDVYVFLEGNANHDLTDVSGGYFLEGVDAGEVSVSFIKTGFYDTTVVQVTVNSFETTTVDVTLHNENDAEVIIWYGNLDTSPIQVSLGQQVDINTYISTRDYVYINDMMMCLGAQDRYIDSLLSYTEGEFYFPFTEWQVAEYRQPFGSPPNPEGWSSQPFFGFACVAHIPGFPCEYLHFDTPTLGLKFVVKTSTETGNMGQLVHGIGRGLDPLQGPSNAGDTLGNINYQLSEHFSPLYFSGKAIQGQITNQNSQPLANVYVEIIGGDRHAFSNSTGHYVLNDLQPGYYNLRFYHPSCQELIRNNVRVYSYQNTTLNVQMQELGNLGGVITNPEAEPIESVLVTLGSTGLETYSSTEGEYFFELIDVGNYQVTYSHPDYFDQLRNVNISGGDTAVVNVVMPFLGAIDGLVQDINTVPIENAHVVLNSTGKSADTDLNGHFFFEKIDPGTYSITITHPDFALKTISNVAVISGDTTEVMATMELLAVISGAVTKTDNVTPLEGVHLVLRLNNSPVDSLLTDTDGLFEFNHLVQGNYRLTATKTGYVTQTIYNINGQYDDTTVVDILLVEDIGSINGVITGMGSPLEGAHVTAMATAYQAFSDASGSYEITSVPSGSYNLKFYIQGYQDYYSLNVAVLPEQTTVLDVAMEEKQYDLTAHLFTNAFYRAGGTGYYSCICQNLGMGTAANAVLRLTLPDEVSYIGSTPAGVYADGVVTWDIGDFPAFAVMNFQVDFDIAGDAQDGQYLAGEAGISSDSPDADMTNNHADVSSPVLDTWNSYDKYASPPGLGVNKFIPGDASLAYDIFFENEAGAPVDVNEIIVIDTLDLDLDLDTYVPGPNSHESYCITTLDYASREIVWTFTDVGLPPNNNPPEGEGFVSYFVKPFSTSPNNTGITNQAAVKFDDDPWQMCPTSGPLLRTLDKQAPASGIAGIPEGIFGDTVTLSWSANDFGGAGIDFVELYASVDDGPYSLVYTAPPEISQYLFQGETDHCYSFYSVAADLVGNREEAPSEADAFTCFAVGYLYLPGDANMYLGLWPPLVIGSDVVYLVNFFRNVVSQPCRFNGFYASADINGDCRVIGSDVTYLVNYFRGIASQIHFCPDYPSAWEDPSNIPEDRPEGWPPCETYLLKVEPGTGPDGPLEAKETGK